MTINVNSYGDNPFQPGMVADSYTPDQLIAGALQLVTQEVIVKGGPYARGTLLGRVSVQPVESAAGVNTGNGTVGSISTGAGVKNGAYVLTAKSATDFGVVDPEGNVLTDATVGTAYSNSGILFTLTAGGTAFAIGDSFTLTVVPGAVGQFQLCVSTASDGSQNPACILVDNMPVAGPEPAAAYFMGEFNSRAVTFDPSWTLATLRGSLPAGLFLKSSVSAADPT